MNVKLKQFTMSANLKLLPRKEFEITLSDGTTVKGKFGTWSLQRFGDKKKMGLKQIIESFSSEMKLSDMLDFIVCAVEYVEQREKKPPFFNTMILCEWIDDYTAVSGNDGVITTLFTHSSSSDEMEGEKKTSTGDQAMTSIAGQPSSELLTQPA